jgi:hypothetical protein
MMTDKYILNGQGDPVPEPDLMRWGEWFECSGEQRRIALTQIAEGISVSTVFLALDHSFGCGPPVLWETMIFGGEHDGEQWRYTSKDEALIGHDFAVHVARGDFLDGDVVSN